MDIIRPQVIAQLRESPQVLEDQTARDKRKAAMASRIRSAKPVLARWLSNAYIVSGAPGADMAALNGWIQKVQGEILETMSKDGKGKDAPWRCSLKILLGTLVPSSTVLAGDGVAKGKKEAKHQAARKLLHILCDDPLYFKN
jgi:hypothetical protein